MSDFEKKVVFTLDKQGNCTWICESIKDVSGYTAEEIIGTNISKYIHPDDFDTVIKRFSEPQIGFTKTEIYRVIRKDGSVGEVVCKTLVTFENILGEFCIKLDHK